MVKCEYCGKKIGLLAIRYTWIENGKRAIHDSCLKEQEFEKEIQNDEKLMEEIEILVKSQEKKLKQYHKN
ncbi:MAG: hypothetical protein MUO82_05445 [Candidatus Thermoplasmatota archaeon]|nr:hypothetical protein [Candidatus Thermoplasmatota archaeon]